MGFLDTLQKELQAVVGTAEAAESRAAGFLKGVASGTGQGAIDAAAAASSGSVSSPTSDVPFIEVDLQLADIQLLTGKVISLAGVELYFRREGSLPNVRMDVLLSSGTVHRMYPGMRLRAPFSAITFTIAQGWGNLGNSPYGYMTGTDALARFVVTRTKGALFDEPEVPVITYPTVSLGVPNFDYANTNITINRRPGIPAATGNPQDLPWMDISGISRFGFELSNITNVAAGATLTAFPCYAWGFRIRDQFDIESPGGPDAASANIKDVAGAVSWTNENTAAWVWMDLNCPENFLSYFDSLGSVARAVPFLSIYVLASAVTGSPATYMVKRSAVTASSFQNPPLLMGLR